MESWGVMGDVYLGILFDICVKCKKERSPLR